VCKFLDGTQAEETGVAFDRVNSTKDEVDRFSILWIAAIGVELFRQFMEQFERLIDEAG